MDEPKPTSELTDEERAKRVNAILANPDDPRFPRLTELLDTAKERFEQAEQVETNKQQIILLSQILEELKKMNQALTSIRSAT